MSVLKITIRHLICSCLFITLSMSSSYAQNTSTPEYQLKAVFLFNFTQFIEWPEGSFATEQSPLIIGILGEDPFGSYLSDVVSGEKVNGHPIMIMHFRNYEDIKTCHILFIANNEMNKMEQITASLKKHHILTVSDAPNFLYQGGMIRFFIKNNKIQFQINLDVAREDNLVISSKLLRLADIYVSGKK